MEKKSRRAKNPHEKNAEIFTPPEVCKTQNDLVIGDTKDFEKFIDAKFLEITCGEAPYITSRYNAVTGEPIDFDNRVDILDKKLKIIAKETKDVSNLKNFTERALKSVYGYEFQGDNLFLARRNIFETVAEFLSDKLAAKEFKEFLPTIADIISWNFWQMDGLTNSPPFMHEKNLFDGADCKIRDWREDKEIYFRTLVKEV